MKDSLDTYDGIFFDTFGDDGGFSSSLSNWTKSGTKVTFWNNDYSDTNSYNIPNVTYQSINVLPEANSYFTGSTTYYMPMREF